MELSVVIEPIAADGFRASCVEPIPASAEGSTRDEALSKLREQIVHRVQAGVEIVKLRIDGLSTLTSVSVWPDDQLTSDWLAGIAEARTAADGRPDPWDGPAEQP
jgi:hypothetical protein